MGFVVGRAPSNIALIKYMGKIPGTGNKPTNASLSWTLPHLLTEVRLTKMNEGHDIWEPLMDLPGFVAPDLSEKGREKFISHFTRLKAEWDIEGHYRIQSANNFPSDCGLASSASSFAALTNAAANLAQTQSSKNIGPSERSIWSRKGSGSSCRSFFSPWALWENEGAEPVDCGYDKLLHAAVVISSEVKEVSSSEAHVQVTSSPKFEGRVERAHQRLRELMNALREKNWAEAYRHCRDEYIDMHELFETSEVPFKYRTKESNEVTDACQHIWNFKNDGPLVTMDAGPNVHLLFREDQLDLANKMVDHFKVKHMVFSSWRGLK